MTDTLFDLPETLSPRLLWMKQHQIRTHKGPDSCDDEYDPWSAWLPEHDHSAEFSDCFAIQHSESVGYGKTENEAIIDLAVRHKIPLWNEPSSEPAK